MSATNFAYSNCDYIRFMAQRYDMEMRGTHLLSGNHIYSANPPPSFLEDVEDPAVIEDFMMNYISTTVGHYRGKAFAWDVVDEAVPDKVEVGPFSPLIHTHTPYAKVNDYICKAFTAAWSEDSKAELMYSDYGFESMAGW